MHQIAHSIDTHATPAAARAAINTAAGIQSWWSLDSDIDESGAGANHELRFQKGDREVTMRFRVDVDDPERVRWICTENGNPVWVDTTLEWRFEDGRVAFVHAGFRENKSPPYMMTEQGWGAFIDSLAKVLAGEAGSPI